MRLAQRGDQTAYAELLGVLTTVTRQFARRKSGDVPWVEDVVQETLISVHRARHTYDPGRPFAPWFYAIAAHRVVDVYRRERRIASREQGRNEWPGWIWMLCARPWRRCRPGNARLWKG